MTSGINSTSTNSTLLDTSKLKAHQEEMFAKMDTNGDGTIDKAEFTAFMQQRQQTGSTGDRPSAADIFTKMDTNGDGTISKAEFEAYKPAKPHGGHGKHGQPDLSKLFATIDTNGDGSISQSEFESYLQGLESQMTSATGSQTTSGAPTTLVEDLNQADSSSSSSTNSYLSNGQNSPTASDTVLNLVG